MRQRTSGTRPGETEDWRSGCFMACKSSTAVTTCRSSSHYTSVQSHEMDLSHEADCAILLRTERYRYTASKVSWDCHSGDAVTTCMCCSDGRLCRASHIGVPYEVVQMLPRALYILHLQGEVLGLLGSGAWHSSSKEVLNMGLLEHVVVVDVRVLSRRD